MLADHIPTQFAVKSGTSVLVHHEVESYCVKKGFIAIVTAVPTIYTLGDLLFAPGEYDWKSFFHKFDSAIVHTLDAKTVNRRYALATRMAQAMYETASSISWFEHTLQYFYGFVLPVNERHVDLMLVRESDVAASNTKNERLPTFDKPPMSKIQQRKHIYRDVQHQRDKNRG